MNATDELKSLDAQFEHLEWPVVLHPADAKAVIEKYGRLPKNTVVSERMPAK